MHTDGYEIKWIDASAHDTEHAGVGVCMCVCVSITYISNVWWVINVTRISHNLNMLYVNDLHLIFWESEIAGVRN